jgi:hypothetical protein
MACDGGHVTVGDRRLELPLRNLRWASPWSATDSHNDKEISCATRALKRGDVVWVRREMRTFGRFREFYMPDDVNPSWQHSQDQPTGTPAQPRRGDQLEQVPAPAGRAVHGRPPHRLRHRDGRRLRLRAQRAQPRGAVVPAAGLDLQADLLLGGDRRRLRLRLDVLRPAGVDRRPGHRRGVDADQPPRLGRQRRHARVRAGVLEEHPVGGDLLRGRRRSRRAVGPPARLHLGDHRRQGAGAGRVVHLPRRAVAGVLDLRAQRPLDRLDLRPPHPRSPRQRHRGSHGLQRPDAGARRPPRSAGRDRRGARPVRRSRRAPRS